MNTFTKLLISILFILVLFAIGIVLHEAGAHRIFLILVATAIVINGMNYFWRKPGRPHHHRLHQ